MRSGGSGVDRRAGLRPTTSTVPTIDSVVAMTNVVERNRAITLGYHELSEAVCALLGYDHANWMTFGQWASAEAGRAIRGESIPSLVRPLLGHEIEAAVAGGNAAVFGDVGPAFVRFILAFRSDPDAQSDPVRAAVVLGELCSHPDLTRNADLTRAFTAYTDALLLSHATDSDSRRRRAQRMLVANVSIGAAEQLVADPFVRAAIPGRSLVAIIATAHMGIHLPDAVLALDRDVPPPAYLDGTEFPVDLASLSDPDLVALADRFGQAPDSAVNSDAPDWESYEERMGFIFTFLRAYQCDPALFEMPARSH